MFNFKRKKKIDKIEALCEQDEMMLQEIKEIKEIGQEHRVAVDDLRKCLETMQSLAIKNLGD